MAYKTLYFPRIYIWRLQKFQFTKIGNLGMNGVVSTKVKKTNI